MKYCDYLDENMSSNLLASLQVLMILATLGLSILFILITL